MKNIEQIIAMVQNGALEPDTAAAQILAGSDDLDCQANPRAPGWQIERVSGDLARLRLNQHGDCFAHHVIATHEILPAAVLLEGVATAFRLVNGLTGSVLMSEVIWLRHVTPADPVLDITFVPIGGESVAWAISVRPADSPDATPFFEGRLRAAAASRVPKSNIALLLSTARERAFSVGSFYELYEEIGVRYGPSFQTVQNLFACGPDTLRNGVCNLQVDRAGPRNGSYRGALASLLDGALQSMILLGELPIEGVPKAEQSVLFPTFADLVLLTDQKATAAYAWCRPTRSLSTKGDKFDITLMDHQGGLLAEIVGLAFRPATKQQMITSSERAIPKVGSDANAISAPTGYSEHPVKSGELRSNKYEELIQVLVEEVAALAAMGTVQVRIDLPLQHFGIDSIMQRKLLQFLEELVGTLPQTFLFEYTSISEIAQALIAEGRVPGEGTASRDKSGDAQSPDRYGLGAEREVHEQKTDWTSAQRKVHASGSSPAASGSVRPEIAIVGLSGRYPGADTMTVFWNNLLEGKNAITRAPDWRWQDSHLQWQEGSSIPRPKDLFGGFLGDVFRFDSGLFGVAARDVATQTTPETRIMLEVGWEAFETAGYGASALRALQEGDDRKIGVFTAVMYNHYSLSRTDREQAMFSASLSDWNIANRLSHHFDLTGPSITVNTACSGSLSALHLACEAVRRRECVMALAGGINLTLHSAKYLYLTAAKFLASGDASKSFGVSDGYIPGEGCGVAIVKRLDEAERDGDPIYGIVRNSVLNHGGGRQAYGAPDVKRQADLIYQAIADAGLATTEITYVDCAANGSPLGDPIEIIALQRAFARHTPITGGDAVQSPWCALGSVKSNIGHLESASGMSQLTKAILQMMHRTRVPTINADPINPNIELEGSPFYLQRELERWDSTADATQSGSAPLCCMVNSFGAGGSYASIVLSSYTDERSTADSASRDASGPHAFVFAAADQDRLKAMLEQMISWLDANDPGDLNVLSQYLMRRSHALAARFVCIASSAAELTASLTTWCQYGEHQNVSTADLDKGDAIQNAAALNGLPELEAVYAWLVGDFVPPNLAIAPITASRILALPTYPFDHSAVFANGPNLQPAVTPIIISDLDEATGLLASVPAGHSFIRDHKVGDDYVVVGAIYACLAAEAYLRAFPNVPAVMITRLNYIGFVSLDPADSLSVEIKIQRDPVFPFTARAKAGQMEQWMDASIGRLGPSNGLEFEPVDIATEIAARTPYGNIASIFQSSATIVIGDFYRVIEEYFLGNDQKEDAFVKIVPHVAGQNWDGMCLEPVIMQTLFSCIVPLMRVDAVTQDMAFVPFSVREITIVRGTVPKEFWARVTLRRQSSEFVLFDADIFDALGKPYAVFKGCSLRRLAEKPATDSGLSHKTASMTIVDGTQSQIESAPQTFSISQHQDGTTFDMNDDQSVPLNIEDFERYVTNLIKKHVSDPKLARRLKPKLNLMDAGLESKQLAAITSDLADDIGEELDATLLFEHSSVSELARYLADAHYDRIVAKLKPAAQFVTQPVAMAQPYSGSEAASSHLSIDLTRTAQSAVTNVHASSGRFAIIGMDGKFAQSESINDLWRGLLQKKDFIEEVPLNHWDYRPWYNSNPGVEDRTYCKWGGFIQNVEFFDAEFFNISPREAVWMDPQLRMLMQSLYSTAENAGFAKRLRGTATGVFVGVALHNYADKITDLNLPINPYIGLGQAQSVLANRLSFQYDLTGPSIAYDTACSSSLVALHAACQALEAQECDQAFVAGANLLLSSTHYRYFCSIRALSPTGRCYSFDARADGYVPGECVASILLKPLEAALRDGDRIEAVILGSAALHGGYTPSLSAPSVSGEERVIVKAWQDADIDPGTITYIEAHGTGTAMGDPIEFKALNNAFRQFTPASQFCALGSLKSSIGHTEGAAGIAGLLKVVQQLKHKIIPAMPNFRELNPNIRSDNSPLFVPEQAISWTVPEGQPRRAGISSFGFAGAYAHVVLEEAPNDVNPVIQMKVEGPLVLPVSARTPKQLTVLLQALSSQLDGVFQESFGLLNIARSLQYGREDMECRFAAVAESTADFLESIQTFLQSGRPDNRSRVRLGEEDVGPVYSYALLSTSGPRDSAMELAERWVSGNDVDWVVFDRGHGKAVPAPLPTYPFESVRHWITDGLSPDRLKTNRTHPVDASSTHASRTVLHPLLHYNVSGIAGLRFTSSITDRDSELLDHQINGERLLSGVAQLEIAVTGIAEVAGVPPTSVSLRDVVWLRPVDERAASELALDLSPAGDGQIEFMLRSHPFGSETSLLARGRGHWGRGDDPQFQPAVPDTSGMPLLREWSGEAAYEAFAQRGLQYGPSYRAIERLRVFGSSRDNLVFEAAIKRPETELDGRYAINTGMADAALQAAIGLQIAAEEAGIAESGLLVPFALNRLDVFGPFPASGLVVGQIDRYASDAKQVSLSMTVIDQDHNPVLRLEGFQARHFGQTVEVPQEFQLYRLYSGWREAPCRSTVPVGDRVVLLVGARAEVMAKRLSRGNRIKVRTLKGGSEIETAAGFELVARAVLEHLQQLASVSALQPIFVQIVVDNATGVEDSLLSGLSAMLLTVAAEMSALPLQLVQFDETVGIEDAVRLLELDAGAGRDVDVRHGSGRRYVRVLTEAIDRDKSAPNEGPIWKDRGVFLLIGGLGEIGRNVARHVARNTNGAHLALCGRSDVGAADLLRELQELGAEASFTALDIADSDAVADWIADTRRIAGEITGVMHLAGCLIDRPFTAISDSDFATVMRPKVAGLEVLDRATASLPLEFFLTFSSIVGVTGNPGQAAYAAANGFADRFIVRRQMLVQLGHRFGRSLSIDWPYWRDGGMHPSPTAIARLRKVGFEPLPAEVGLDAIELAIAAEETGQMLLVFGSEATRRTLLQGSIGEETIQETKNLEMQAPDRAKIDSTFTQVNDQAIERRAITYFRALFADVFGISGARIREDTTFETLGIDSILIMELNRRLEEHFSILPKTLFFEYRCLRDIVGYFREYHREVFDRLLGVAGKPASVPSPSVRADQPTPQAIETLIPDGSADVTKPAGLTVGNDGFREQSRPRSVIETGDHRIAVIGMCGRFPGADTVDEFWQVLSEGRDCVSEIPADRWPVSAFFSEKKDRLGKSYCKWGGFLSDAVSFDPYHFNISPRDAEAIDPQERIFLECVSAVLDDAGYTPARLQRARPDATEGSRVAVFVGVMYQEHQLYGAQGQVLGSPYAVNGSPASIANRISYQFDFNGPSMVVDSMCSSSLTAIYLACEGIQAGRFEVAVAGGVNLSLHPNKYLMLAQGRFASSVGRCKSFGEGGDGYVPGEAAAAVLLKPYAHAVADGDNIYGVILGAALNHGGRTNGYTVPDPKAQKSVIADAIMRAGISGSEIGYIEAHGTGTSLGDPIEIAGLNMAFASVRAEDETWHCAIGSAKSNIGHCESAAGIAGVIKLLLQLRHKMIAPSIHSEVLNANIDFDASPFRLQRKLGVWSNSQHQGKSVETTAAAPLIGAVSSFGAGGSNGHIVIAEHRTLEDRKPDVDVPIAVISAKTEVGLKKVVARLLERLEGSSSISPFADVIFTLQAGREHYQYRLAIIVEECQDLLKSLRFFLDDVADPAQYTGEADADQDLLSTIASDDHADAMVTSWFAVGKWDLIAQFWTKGLSVDWEAHWQTDLATRALRTNLPTYPLERERFWILDNVTRDADTLFPAEWLTGNLGHGTARAAEHHLLHRNRSNAFELGYESIFAESDPWFADHRIGGRALLPGTVGLEMASEGYRRLTKSEDTMELRDVRWSRALVGEGERICIQTSYEIASDGDAVFAIASDGGVAGKFIGVEGRIAPSRNRQPQSEKIEILQGQTDGETVSASQLYRAFVEVGMEYSRSHRCVVQVSRGTDLQERRFLLAALQSDDATPQDRRLPGMLDSALQAIFADALFPTELTGKPDSALVPVSLGSLVVWGPCPETALAIVRMRDSRGRRFDVTVVNADGEAIAEFEDLAFESLQQRAKSPNATENILLQPTWNASEARPSSEEPLAYRRIVIAIGSLGHSGTIFRDSLIATSGLAAADVHNLSIDRLAKPEALGVVYEALTQDVLAILAAAMRQSSERVTLVQLVVDLSSPLEGLSEGFAGLLRTASIERPDIRTQLILVQDRVSADDLSKRLACDARDVAATELRYDAKGRASRGLQEIQVDWTSGGSLWTQSAVYVIAGGMGGVGLEIAKDIAAHAQGATLVLLGRSRPNDAIRANERALRKLGVNAEYHQCDVCDAVAVDALIAQILTEQGRLDGVIHAVGVTSDSFIMTKTPDAVASVLRPKVSGAINLDRATGAIRLKFFLLFSSLTSVLGNSGQGDYAAANGFLDAFAARREVAVKAGDRFGRSLSINWPLWRGVGMQVDQAVLARMVQLGMQPLEPVDAVRALRVALAVEGASQIAVICGDGEAIRRRISDFTARNFPNTIVPQIVKPDKLRRPLSSTHGYVRDEIARILKMPAERLEVDRPLMEFGLDSVVAMTLIERFQLRFGSLPQTLFFEYGTVRSLVEYLAGLTAAEPDLADHSDTISDNTTTGISAAASPSAMEASRSLRYTLLGRDHSGSRSSKPSRSDERIAIIGMAGSYPGAADLEQFWDNLVTGRDCITEVPGERWAHDEIFSTDKTQADRSYSKWGGFLDGVDQFDPVFFGISPREAALLDPQERLFLQCAYEAMDHAGYGARSQLGSEAPIVGVFVGTMYSEYQLFGAQAQSEGHALAIPGSSASIANRVSYALGLTGPSMAVDTMCSSSLTAIHLARRSLLTGECDIVLAGGVNISIHPNKYLLLSQGRFLSSTGRCQTFGEGGDGYVPGEGVGAVVLKRLVDAERDRDHIHGIILGTAINHGGRATGYSVPNVPAQAAVIAQAILDAEIDPATISYIEAHGTGTSLGDPVEIKALSQALEPSGVSQRESKCAIGSVKSSIGHCEGAAGIAGITKVLLQMKHKTLVPSLHSDPLNHKINFATSPFTVQRIAAPWATCELDSMRRAGVSSFGAGGSNAHVLVEEYRPKRKSTGGPASERAEAFILSARKPSHLPVIAQRLLDAIRKEAMTSADFSRIAYTLQVGRAAHKYRVGFVAQSIEQLCRTLEALSLEEPDEHILRGEADLAAASELSDSPHSGTVPTRDSWIAILGHWVRGGEVNWSLFVAELPGRIGLPSYPFETKRYWLPLAVDTTAFGRAARHEGRDGKVGHHDELNSGQPSRASGVDKQVDYSGANTRPLRTFALADASGKPASTGGSEATSGLVRLTKPSLSRELVDNTAQQSVAASDKITKKIVLAKVAGMLETSIPEPVNRSRAKDQSASPAIDVIKSVLLGHLANVVSKDVNVLSVDTDLEDAGLPGPYSDEASRFLQRINAEFGTSINNTRLYDFGSIPALSRHISDLLVPEAPKEPEANHDAITPVGTVAGPVIFDDQKLIAELAQSLAETLFLEVEDVEPDRPFVELGLDSVVGVEWIAKLNERYGVRLEASSLYDVINIQALADFLRNQGIGVGEFCESRLLDRDAGGPAVRPDQSSETARSATDKATGLRPIQAASRSEKRMVPRLEAVVADLTGSLAKTLYLELDDIDPGRPFVELGLDSVVGVEWLQILNETYGLSLEVAALYDVSCVRDLARLICDLVVVDAPTMEDHRAIGSRMASTTKASAESVMLEMTVPPTENSYNSNNCKTEADVADVQTHERPVSAKAAYDYVRGADNSLRIAIIGMSGRYPGAQDLSTYWRNLISGVCSVEEVPADRWDVAAFFDPRPGTPNKTFCKWLGAISDADKFDPAFFSISESESAEMDPQHRLLLQEALLTFEDAGYPKDRVAGSNCGVFVGLMNNDYGLLRQKRSRHQSGGANNSAALAPARIAYHFDLTGPAVPVDTTCSSGLVALHFACRSLAEKEIDMGLVAAATLYLDPDTYIGMSSMGMLSATGQAASFDDVADGFVPGEAVAAVLLKRLEDALRDGDRVDAVIVASGINHDGRTNGILAPSRKSQVKLLNSVYAKYNIDPASIDYVESHGTGTRLGDAIELSALAEVFAAHTKPLVGSNKGNIGHTSAASGLASLQKLVLSMRHSMLAPTLHHRTTNALATSDYELPQILTAPRSWLASPHKPRRGAVSVFGINGTNAHLVVDAPEGFVQTADGLPMDSAAWDMAHVVPLSAASDQQLADYARSVLEWLASEGRNLPIAAIARTLQTAKHPARHRLAVLAKSSSDLAKGLSAHLGKDDGQSGLVTAALLDNRREQPLGDSEALAHKWVAGEPVEWAAAMVGSAPPPVLAMPGYPFRKQRFWIDDALGQAGCEDNQTVVAKASAGNIGEMDITADGAASDLPLTSSSESCSGAMQQAAAAILGCEPNDIDIAHNWSEIGFDSIKVARFVAMLQGDHGIHVNAIDLYEHTTIRALASRISDEVRIVSETLSSGANLDPSESPDKSLPLSLTQSSYWYLYNIDDGSAMYNIPFLFALNGELNVTALRQALDWMASRHDTLRTVFTVVDSQVRQQVLDRAYCDFEIKSVTPETLSKALDEELQHRFLLTQRPQFRATLFAVAPDHHVVCLLFHHITMDGWSLGVFQQELVVAYNAFEMQQEPPLPVVGMPLATLVAQEQKFAAEDAYAKQLGYWRDKLAGLAPMLDLPCDYPRPAKQSFKGGQVLMDLSADLTARVRAFGKANNISTYSILLAGLAIVLSRYARTTDVPIGTAVANRNTADTFNMLGSLANTVPVRIEFDPETSFRLLAKKVQILAIEALQSGSVPFDAIVREVVTERNMGVPPIFQVMFRLHDARQIATANWCNLEMATVIQKRQSAELDLNVNLVETADTIEGEIVYASDLFSEQTVQRLCAHLKKIVEDGLSAIDEPISALSLLGDEEVALIREWNHTDRDYPDNECMHHLFEHSARAAPNKLAYVCGEDRLSYQELNTRANQLAHYLIGCGVGPEVRVGVSVGRSVWMGICALAVFKAGGTYVPLDPSYPAARIEHMLEVARPTVILTDIADPISLRAFEVERIVQLDAIQDALGVQSLDDPSFANEPEQSAYILFTSGSTGKPKGILIAHRSFRNMFEAHKNWNLISRDSVVLQFASLSFSISLWNSFMAWTAGGTLVQVCDDESIPGEPFYELLRRESVTHATWPVSLLSVVRVEEVSDTLQTVISSAEPCNTAVVRRWTRDGRRFLNMYGNSEISLGSTIYEYSDANDRLTIGRPFPNTQMYVLDDDLRLVPPGVIGEICTGGVGLAKEYVGRPEATAERFINNPMADESDRNDWRRTRLYRTGDLGRYLSDGQIEFIGREDFQVSIRGFRVELTEIEDILRSCEGIDDVAVVARPGPDQVARLVCFFVVREGSRVQPNELRVRVAETLPSYMVPSLFVRLDEMPLTPNRKVNRLGLPEPVFEDAAKGSLRQAETATERELLEIWRRVLGVEVPSVEDSFFAVGGHSLLALQLWEEVKHHFGVDVAVLQLLVDPTIAAQARLIASAVGSCGDTAPSLLELLNRGREGGVPTFLVPGIGGSLFNLLPLSAELAEQGPVYGLRGRGLGDGCEPFANVEDIAAANLAALDQIGVTDDPILVGHSFGGWIAYEMARLLEARGRRVKLVLLDSIPPDWADRAKAMASKDDRGDVLQRFLDRMQDADWTGGASFNGKSIEVEKLLSDIRRVALVQARIVYAPIGSIQSKYLHILAAERDEMMVGIGIDWTNYFATEKLEKSVAAGHFSMLSYPAVKTVAAYIQHFLQP